MWTAKWILDAYEKGTQSARWDMYMNYPGLRTYFNEVEALSDGCDEKKTRHQAEPRPGAKWNLCARLVKGHHGGGQA